MVFIDLILFLTDYYFRGLRNKNVFTKETLIENKRFVFDNINKYFLYNLNQNTLINALNTKIDNE